MATAPAAPTAAKPASVTVATVKAAAGPAQLQATAIAVRAPAFRIREVQRRERYLKLLVYGNYGTGKTFLAGTASQVESMTDILLVNAESGDLTLDAFENIDEITVKTFRTLARVYEFLVLHCKHRDSGDDAELRKLQDMLFDPGKSDDEDDKDAEEPRLRKYRTVIIDSLSEVEQLSLNQVLGITDTTKMDDDPNAAEWKEYKQNNTLILRMVRNFRNLPMNVIFTCAEAYNQDETKKMKYTLDLTGKLSKKVQGFMDMVGYLAAASANTAVAGAATPGQQTEESSQSRRLYVTPSAQGRFDAKHRYVNFKGNYFDNPTISKILQQTGLLTKEGAVVKD